MDSFANPATLTLSPPAQLPGWALPRGRALTKAGAAFAAGIALKSLDDLFRSTPVWAGCWRARQALKCAAIAVRLMGRTEDEAALGDAVLRTTSGDDPGPAGAVFLVYKRLSARKPAFSSKAVAELADLLGLAMDDGLAVAVDHADAALLLGRPAPFAAADLVSAIDGNRRDAEPLRWALAVMLIAAMLNLERPVPLLMAERCGPAFRRSRPWMPWRSSPRAVPARSNRLQASKPYREVLQSLQTLPRFATRYERRSIHFTGLIHLAPIMSWAG